MMGRSGGIKNRTIFIADNLHIMRGMGDESVDLVYMDPPFNKNKNFAAPIGSKAAGAEFKDTWTLDDVDIAWWGEIANKNEALYTVLDAINKTAGDDLMSYSIYMAIRLLEMHRILKPNGSIFLHCDPTASHYLKMILDSIFNSNNFKNEIIWKRSTSKQKGSQHKSKKLGSNHDVILFYCKDKSKFSLENPKKLLTDGEILQKFPKTDPDGRRWKDDSAHVWRTPNMGARPNLCYAWKGFKNPHPSGWRLSKPRLEEEYRKGNFEIVGKKDGSRKLIRKVYLEDYAGENLGDLWDDIDPAQGKERMSFPTQKPLELLKRIIEIASTGGDVVLDPFCGCATTCIASEKLNRKWIGIDISEMALNLIKRRLYDEYPLDQYTKKAAQLIPLTKAPILQGTQSKNIKDTLYGKQHGHCAGCDVHFPYRNLTVDHVIPTSKGGQDMDENKQLLCQSCNSMKGNRMTTDELKAKLARLGIGKGL